MVRSACFAKRWSWVTMMIVAPASTVERVEISGLFAAGELARIVTGE